VNLISHSPDRPRPRSSSGPTHPPRPGGLAPPTTLPPAISARQANLARLAQAAYAPAPPGRPCCGLAPSSAALPPGKPRASSPYSPHAPSTRPASRYPVSPRSPSMPRRAMRPSPARHGSIGSDLSHPCHARRPFFPRAPTIHA
jgi:hypothetical protein